MLVMRQSLANQMVKSVFLFAVFNGLEKWVSFLVRIVELVNFLVRLESFAGETEWPWFYVSRFLIRLRLIFARRFLNMYVLSDKTQKYFF